MISVQKKLFNFVKYSNHNTLRYLSGSTSLQTKHYNPKFKWLRSQKVIPVELPNLTGKMSKEEYRSKMKELGILPPRFWRVRPMTITTLSEIIDPFQPIEGDGKSSLIPTKKGMSSIVSKLKEKKEDIQAKRKIKSYDSNYSTKLFPQEAHDVYVKAHNALMKNDPEELSEYVTETALMEMMSGLKCKTVKWKFIESLEPAVVVQARVAPAVIDSNLFAQVTVRFHTKQMLAIYDRFGRLFYGSEFLAKDVLEYVVFEKHIVNEYGVWRLHAKIIPDWAPPSEPSSRTYQVINLDESSKEEEDEEILEDLSLRHDESPSNDNKNIPV